MVKRVAKPRKNSELEVELMRQLDAEGMKYERERRFAEPRLFRADFIFRRWDGSSLIVECQGGTWSGGRHVRGSGMETDGEKSALAAINGYYLMTVTRKQIFGGNALDWVKQWLALPRGYHGHWHRA